LEREMEGEQPREAPFHIFVTPCIQWL